MRKQVTKGQFINGTIWKLIETVMSVGVTFIVSLILARLLSANDFGVIALTNVFINFSEILLQSAFSAPLIQKEKIDDVDYTSVLVFSMIMAAVLYGVVFVISPTFARIYDQEILTKVLRVISLIFVFQAFGSVRTAIISRQMKFKTLSLCTIISSVLSGAIGIAMAVMGFGVWALVAQKLLYQAILNIVLFIVIKWKPTFEGISFKRVTGLLSFGSKVLASSFVSYVSDSSVSIITGKQYSVTALGYSSKGTQYPCDLSIFSFQAVATALFPTLASYQNDRHSQKMIMRKVVSVVAFLLFPMMIGLMAVSERFIIFLLTEKWIMSVPYMKAACIYYCATPLMLINIQLYHSVGNGDARLKYESVKLFLTLATLIIGAYILKISLQMVFAIRAAIEVLIAAVSVVGLKNEIGYSYNEYIQDLTKPLVQTVLMAVSVMLVGRYVDLSNTMVLFLQVLAGMIIYVVLSAIWKPVGYTELLKIIKERRANA